MNNNILNLINIYIKQEKYSLVDFQLNILDEFDIESSICFNDNDIAEYIEIYGETILRVNSKGELI